MASLLGMRTGWAQFFAVTGGMRDSLCNDAHGEWELTLWNLECFGSRKIT